MQEGCVFSTGCVDPLQEDVLQFVLSGMFNLVFTPLLFQLMVSQLLHSWGQEGFLQHIDGCVPSLQCSTVWNIQLYHFPLQFKCLKRVLFFLAGLLNFIGHNAMP